MSIIDEIRRGHPRGLLYLAFTEAWERFSYYGMTALLVLYMVNQVLLPGHVERIAGFDGFRAALESLSGPLTPLALASQVFGLYTGFVYFTPVLGGLVADRWIGQRNAVVLGAVSMSAGHLAMAFDRSFLLALAAARRRFRFPQGQHLGAGGRPVSVERRSPAHARLRDLQHGDQFRRRRRAAGLRLSRAAVRLALWLRGGRGLHARWTRDLPLWLSPSAGARAASGARHPPAHFRRSGEPSSRSRR